MHMRYMLTSMTLLLYVILYHCILLLQLLRQTIYLSMYMAIEDDKEVIYPLRVSQAVVASRHVDFLLY